MISYSRPCPGVILLQFRELADIWKISSLPFRGSYVCCKLQHEKKGNHCFARRTTLQVYSYANPCLCTMTLFARKMKSFPSAPCKLQSCVLAAVTRVESRRDNAPPWVIKRENRPPNVIKERTVSTRQEMAFLPLQFLFPSS